MHKKIIDKVGKAFHGAAGYASSAVSNIIAAPAIIKSKRAQSQATKDVATIKRARSYDNAPDFNEKGVTDAFKARSLADEVKTRRTKKY